MHNTKQKTVSRFPQGHETKDRASVLHASFFVPNIPFFFTTTHLRDSKNDFRKKKHSYDFHTREEFLRVESQQVTERDVTKYNGKGA